ncbi:hypothetical protein HK101_003453 [Irineochytrium annulatum]|nr:hypothetical protein HK101_003453 [Irineochytrium annulatum]
MSSSTVLNAGRVPADPAEAPDPDGDPLLSLDPLSPRGFLFWLLGGPMPGEKRRTGGNLPEPYKGFFSRATYQWMHPFVSEGYKRPLAEEDLFELTGDLSAAHIGGRLERAWAAELARAKADATGKKPPKMWRALWKAFGVEIRRVGWYRGIADTSAVISPLFVLNLVHFLENTTSDHPPPASLGFGLAIGLFCCQVISGWANHKSFEKGMRAGFKVTSKFASVPSLCLVISPVAVQQVRSAVTSTLYQKCLRLSPKGRQMFTQGRIVNSMSTDTGRMDRATAFLNLIWSVPYITLLCLAVLVYYLGVSAIAGVAFIVVLSPCQVIAMRHLASIRQRASLVTDKRVKVSQEALQGVRVMKLYAWEPSFLRTIADLRKRELRYVRLMLIYRSGISAFTTILPAFASILTFTAFYYTGGVLTAPLVFLSIALFNVLRIPCLLIPIISTELTDATVSLDRIQSIMLADELDSPPTLLPAGNDVAVRVKGGSFLWDVSDDIEAEEDRAARIADDAEGEQGRKMGEAPTETGLPWKIAGSSSKDELATVVQEDDTSSEGIARAAVVEHIEHASLSGIDVEVRRGSLVAIVGAVGSGKSSLLNAMVGEMKRLTGTVEFSGTVGYCPQTAWIQNSTLKENILFGAPFDAERYRQVISDCALTRDLQILPAGDRTEIGERGINLSGGQRQRVSLARAVYFDADVVLLDDPLSAVDAHVGKYLFDNCIMGALGQKTRLLVTHQLHFLPRVDHIYLMEGGRIIESGTYKQLLADGGKFAKLIAEYGGADQDKDDIIDDDFPGEPTPLPSGPPEKASDPAAVAVDPEAALDTFDKKEEEKAEDAGVLMQEEDRARGTLSSKVYIGYMYAAGGFLMVLLTLLLLVFAQLGRMGTDLWLSWWSTHKFPLATVTYLDVYIGWGAIQLVTALASGFVFAYAGVLASMRLHDKALAKVFGAPLEFFDTTPLGRVLNRFSKDVDTLDSLLPESARMFGYTLSLIAGTIALVCAVFPYFLIMLLPAGYCYYMAQAYYRATSRELKRLDNTTRSPLFAHFASGLSGLATIRAYNVTKRFADQNLRLLNWNNRAYFPLIMTQRWLGLRLEAIASLLILACSLFAVAARNSVGAGLAGLAISYSLQVTGILNWCVRVATDTEQNMVSAERMISFDSLPQEASSQVKATEPPPGWPDKGKIEIKSLEMRYRDGLPLVLKGIDITIAAGEKVAVVGRTGAGKSSIILALLRLVEPCGGSVWIDGVDIGTLGLGTLRGRVAVIPQDPVLFSGTLRSNLDPFSTSTDQAIWDALRRADLANTVAANPKQLEMMVSEGGENWSTGQRQLICLARAMLRDASVVILDEATARFVPLRMYHVDLTSLAYDSVDLATDDFIQKAIRRDFKDKTVVTIAHRLNTVIDFDRILVLDAGTVAEFDTPANLLSNPEGRFTSMVADTGEMNAEMLAALARKAKE